RRTVTSKSASKVKYTGTGTLMLEPSYKQIVLIDVNEWNQSIIIEDGMFLACEAALKHKAVMRSNLSSAVLGGEGIFNLGLSGNDDLALESDVARNEQINKELKN